LISNNIFPIDTYSVSALDEFNHIKGNMFIVKLKEKLSVHDHSSDNQLKLTIKYEKAKDGKQEILPSELFLLMVSIRKAILLVQYSLLIREVNEHRKLFSNENKLKILRVMKNDFLKRK